MMTTSLVGVGTFLSGYVWAAAGLLSPVALSAPIAYRYYINGRFTVNNSISSVALGCLCGALTGLSGPVAISLLLSKCGMVSGAIFPKIALIWYTLLVVSSAGWYASYFICKKLKLGETICKIVLITVPVLAMPYLPILSRAFLSCPISCREAIACTVSVFLTNTGLLYYIYEPS